MPLILQYLLLGMTAVTFLGAAFIYLRGAKDKGTIETLDRNNEALTERVNILERDIERRVAADAVRDAQEAAKDERIKALESANEVLRTVDGAAEKVTAVMRALTKHHEQAMGGIETITGGVGGMTTSLDNLSNKMEQVHLDLVQIGHLGDTDDG